MEETTARVVECEGREQAGFNLQIRPIVTLSADLRLSDKTAAVVFNCHVVVVVVVSSPHQ